MGLSHHGAVEFFGVGGIGDGVLAGDVAVAESCWMSRSSDCMPRPRLVSMTLGISKMRFSRMQLLTGCVADHDLDGGDHARFVGAGEQGLADDGLQRVGEHRADLVLLACRVDVDDALDGLRARCGCAGC